VAKHSLLWKFLPHHKAAQKKFYSSSQTSESNVKQAETETRFALSDATDGVSQPQVKAQQQVCATQIQSYMTHAPAVEF